MFCQKKIISCKKYFFLSIGILIFFVLVFFLSAKSTQAQAINLNINASCLQSGSLAELTWTTLDGNPSYNVLRKIGAGEFVTIQMTAGSSFSEEINNNQDYTYKIKADVGGVFYYSNEGSIAAYSCPFLQLSSGCTGADAFVNLTWEFSLGGQPQYYILRKQTGETNFVQLNTVGFNETHYLDNTIESGQTYVYQIRAEKGGDDYFSNQLTSIVVYCAPSFLPASTECQADGPHIILSWKAVSGSLDTYEIFRDGVSLGLTAAAVFNDSPNLAAGQIYQYQARAKWQDGHIENSQILSVESPACAPHIQTAASHCLTALPGGPQIELGWTNLLGVTNFQIYRKKFVEDEFSLLGTTNQPFFQDNLVESLADEYWQVSTLFYKVKAIFSQEQKDSLIEAVSLSSCPPLLSVATVCNSSAFLNPEMHLSWTATQGASHYNVYRQDIGFRFQTSDTFYTDYLTEGDCPGKVCEHTYYIQAVIIGQSPLNSNEAAKSIDCTVIQPPAPAPVLDPPTAFCVNGDSRISLSWSPADNVAYYVVYRNSQLIVNLLETVFEDSGVEAGYTYTYFVVAFGQGGTSTISANVQTIEAVNCTPPSVPNLSLSAGCQNGQPWVGLAWSESSNALSYEIYRSLSPTGFSHIITFDKGSPEFNVRAWKDFSVNFTVTYYYKIKVSGPLGVNPVFSQVQSLVTWACEPSVPVLSLSRACQAGAAAVNLSWTTDEANTTRYEIFRQDVSPVNPLHIIYNPSQKTWQNLSVAAETTYNYKVEAVGFSDDKRSTEGYKNITTALCQLPGSFTLQEPALTCQDSYRAVNLDWSDSQGAETYSLLKNRLDPGNNILETTETNNVSSPVIEQGQGRALKFSDNYDYTTIPDDSSLSPQRISLEAWVYPTAFNYYGNIVTKRNPGYQYILRFYDYTGYVQGYVYAGGSWRACTTNQLGIAAQLDQWNHLVQTYDGSVGRVYINGTLGCSYAYNGVIASDNSTVRIGSYYTYGTYYERFRGVIDEVRIYGRALSQAEVLEHYQGTFNNESELRGLWHFDEGSGQQVTDSSDFGNHGYLGNSIFVDTYDPDWYKRGPQSGERYNWQVKANNFFGQTLSNLTSPITLPVCYPQKPGLSLEPICQGDKAAIKLNWSYSLNAVQFEIDREAAANPLKVISLADPEFSQRSWIDNNQGAGLTQENTYTHWIKAQNSLGEKGSNNISVVTPLCEAPNQPANLKADFFCAGTYPRVNLTWDGVANADYYSVYRGGSLLLNTTQTSYVDSGVSVNTPYAYFVIAYSIAGPSQPSGVFNITTGYCPPAKPVITGLTTDCQGGSAVNQIKWSDAAVFNTEAYYVYRQPSGAPDNLIATITPGMPEFSQRTWQDNSGLASAASYQYWIKTDGYYAGTERKALSFDGNDDYVIKKPLTNFPNTEISAEFWMKTSDVTKAGTPLSYASAGSDNDFLIYNYQNLTPHIRGQALATNVSANDGVWHHLVLTWRSSDGQMKLYKDGIENFSGNLQASVSLTNNGSLVFGQEQDSIGGGFELSQAFLGLLDGVRIYNRVLTAAEIQEHYQNVFNNETGLVGLWSFDEGSGSIAADTSGNANHASVIGAQWTVDSDGFALSDVKTIQTYACGLTPTAPNLQLSGLSCQDNRPQVSLSWNNTDYAQSYNIYRENPDSSNSVYPSVASLFTDQGDSVLEFDGNITYLDIPNDVSLNPTQAIAMEVWVYPYNFSEYYPYILEKYYGSTNQYLLRFYYYTGRVEGYVYVNGGWRYCTTASNVAAQLNQWNHIVQTYDGDVGRVYVNGVLGCTYNYSGQINTGTASLRIGSYYPYSQDTYYHFNGLIDEVRIYSRALSGPEILEHYNGNYNNEAELRGAWHFNDGSGTTALDSSGNDNHGAIYGAQWQTGTVAEQKPGYTSRPWSSSSYKYKVKALGADTASDFSNEILVNTPDCLPTPTLSGSDFCTYYNNPVTVLHWPLIANASEYLFYKNNQPWQTIKPQNIFSSDSFLKHWLLIGPFPNLNYPNCQGYSTDYIEELSVLPRAGELVNGKTWFEYNSPSDYINFDNIFSPKDYQVAYGFTYLYSAQEQDVQLRLGSDDGIKTFLNGQQVHDHHIHRAASPDQDIVNVHLKQGLNTLLIKVGEASGSWGFYARLTDASVNNVFTNLTTWDSSASYGENNIYYLKAQIDSEATPASADLDSLVLDCSPAKPGLTLEAQCQNELPRLRLDWQDDSSGNTLYWSVYKRRETDTSFFHLIDLAWPGTEYIDENVESGVVYKYYVEAVGRGLTTFSDVLQKEVSFCYPVPTKPEISLTPQCYGYSSRIEITWAEDPQGNTISYNVWRKKLGEMDFVKIYSGLPATATRLVDVVPEEGASYFYQLEARGAGEDNAIFSDSSQETTSIACSTVPPFPPNLYLNFSPYASVNFCAVSLGWTDSGNEERYKVFRRLQGEPEFALFEIPRLLGINMAAAAYDFPLVEIETATEPENVDWNYIDYTVEETKTYEYQIAAENANGETYSNILSVTIPIAPPGNFTLSVVKLENSVHLSWSVAAHSDAGGQPIYEVYRDNNSNFSSPTFVCLAITNCAEGQEINCSCDDLFPNLLERYYRAVATNNGGSTYSNTCTVPLPLPRYKEI